MYKYSDEQLSMTEDSQPSTSQQNTFNAAVPVQGVVDEDERYDRRANRSGAQSSQPSRVAQA